VPLTYTVDAPEDLIRVVGSGIVTAMDVSDHWMGLFRDVEAMRMGHALVDVRNADLRFTEQQMMHLTRTIYAPHTANRQFRLATLVRDEEQFLIAKQLFNAADLSRNHAVFYEIEEAMKWLNDRSDPSADPS
jgi:hypothetical protein